MPDAIDPYKVLQVDPEAEDEVIQAAYRRLARKYHPDLAATAEAATRMAAINVAWELIGDPAARQDFDRARSIEAKAPLTPAPAPGPTRASPARSPRSPLPLKSRSPRTRSAVSPRAPSDPPHPAATRWPPRH